MGSQGSSRRLVFDPGIPLPLQRSLQRRKVRAFDRRHHVLATELRSICVIQGAVRRWLVRRVVAPAVSVSQSSRRGSRSVRRGKLKARVSVLVWSSVDDLFAEFGVSMMGVRAAPESVMLPLSARPVPGGHGGAAASCVGSVPAAGVARVPGLRSGVVDGDATEGGGAATHPVARPPSWLGFVQLPEGAVRRCFVRRVVAPAASLSQSSLRGSRSVRRGKLKARVSVLVWSSVDDLFAEFGVSMMGVRAAPESVMLPLSARPVPGGHGGAAASCVGSVPAAGVARVPGLRSGVVDGDATEGGGAATHPVARPPSWLGFVQLPEGAVRRCFVRRVVAPASGAQPYVCGRTS